MSQIKSIFIVLICVFLFINLIINKNIMNLKIVNKKGKKVLGIIVFVTVLIEAILCITIIVGNITYYFDSSQEDTLMFEEIDKLIVEEQKNYEEILNGEYDIENCKNPYIFDGFTYVEGTWDTGFVIQDENGNEFVWVPCTNKENNENIEVLKKSNFGVNVFINKFECNEENYEEFLRSSLENGGFYISRFEIGKNENNEPVSKKDCKAWINVSRIEAEQIAQNMYTDINSKLINGYAYDTAFSWIINNENVESISKEKIYIGTKSYKNIYDMLDDIYEITSENYYGKTVYRGISFDSESINIESFDNRLICEADDKNTNMTFRTVLYK